MGSIAAVGCTLGVTLILARPSDCCGMGGRAAERGVLAAGHDSIAAAARDLPLRAVILQHFDRSHTSKTFNDRWRTQLDNSLSPTQVSISLLV